MKLPVPKYLSNVHFLSLHLPRVQLSAVYARRITSMLLFATWLPEKEPASALQLPKRLLVSLPQLDETAIVWN